MSESLELAHSLQEISPCYLVIISLHVAPLKLIRNVLNNTHSDHDIHILYTACFPPSIDMHCT